IVLPTVLGGGPEEATIGSVGAGNEEIIETALRLANANDESEEAPSLEIETIEYDSSEGADSALVDGVVDLVLVDGSRLVVANSAGLSGSSLVDRIQRAAATVEIERIVAEEGQGAADVIDLAARLDELEAANGLDAGCVRIIALCTERPQALFSLGGYSGASERLVGLSWGAEDLGVAVGATQTRGADGEWLPPYQIARVLCLFAAAAAGVAAIDTVYTDFRDADGLAHYAANARRDGFSGMLAIHPAQVDVINAAFTPTQQEVERAERIIALFDDNPDAGTLGMDGEMLDRPHLLAAERIVALSKSKK
ncbi:MAG: aldolase/citrate lyase family protein, partial [Woeseiaceae bacterium]|nr:aldolase/citrate lyase family protein [Woeseiaceae bacterium]